MQEVVEYAILVQSKKTCPYAK